MLTSRITEGETRNFKTIPKQTPHNSDLNVSFLFVCCCKFYSF